jgi:hypothetical protein
MVAIAQKNRGRVIPADGTLWDPALLGSALIYTSGSARASDENSPCRMVKAARDARLSVALTQHSNRSLPTPVSAVGKRNFPGQRQRPRNGPCNSVGRLQRQNACTNRRQFGAIRTEPGNLRLRKTAWWGWEDSNLQPSGYEPPSRAGRTRTCNQTIISRQL